VAPEPDERWQDWLTGLSQRLRRALLAHPDGARVISASQLSLKMAAISELAMSTLVACGLPQHQARLLVLTVDLPPVTSGKRDNAREVSGSDTPAC
jgi:TetR/AcrR family tetracycline transcriptional repressor